MHLILEFEKTGQKWQVGSLLGVYDFDFENGVNLGCDIDMDGASYAQFLSVKGTLTSDRYPQSDITKPISFYLDPKILVLNLSFTGASEAILDKSSVAFSAILGSSEPIEFTVRKFVENGTRDFNSSVYSFKGIVKGITRTLFGDQGYNLVIEVEMIEPRFSRLEYNNLGELVPKSYSLSPKVQGLKFPLKFPAKFGSGGNTLEIINNGNSPVAPIVTFENAATNLQIVTPKGTFQFNSSIIDGQTLTIDVENISAKLDDLEFNSFCTGFEALTLETGTSNWTISAGTLSATSLITVEFFEKYQSL